MTEKTPSHRAKALGWLRTRGAWFSVGALAVVAVLSLWGGVQRADSFGQWLSVLGSLITSSVALWIATTGRSHEARQRDADLEREAGLVRVSYEKISRRQYGEVTPREPGIAVRNRRASRIFELEVARVVVDGQEVELRIASVDIYPMEGRTHSYSALDLTGFVVETDQMLGVFPKEPLSLPADLVVIEYTDSSGRRWRVDTNGKVERL